MRSARIAVAVTLALAALAALAPAATLGAEKPVWRLTVTSQPTDFSPGDSSGSFPLYDIVATNIGSGPTTEPFTITDPLPEGLTPRAARIWHNNTMPTPCAVALRTITCEDAKALGPGENELVEILVDVAPLAEGAELLNQVGIAGGGALPVEAETTTTVTSAPPGFGFLRGPNGASAVLSGLDGSPVSGAGSHPYQLTVDLGLNSKYLGNTHEISGAGGGLRDLSTDLPRGFIADPAATPVLCTEAELESYSCPNASAVGIVTVLTVGNTLPQPSESPLFNMVPPAGEPAQLGFDAAAVGIFVHLRGEVRSDGDYGLSATTNDALARSVNPVLAAQAQLWGDPSDPSHDSVRGRCDELTFHGKLSCPVQPQKTAFLTLPGQCSASISIGARADSWEDPGDFRTGSGPITDPSGAASGVDGCNGLEFKPTISSKPTTNVADSPSGLDFSLRQPQDFELQHAATASLKDATVTLPAGMAVNPAQGDGLAACSEAQIGFEAGKEGIHFSKRPDECPDAAKLGTVEVVTPLLAQYDETGAKPELDLETGAPIPRPVHGAVYIAKPFENPFGSLLAIYLSIEDPQSGTVAKLAGRVIPDPHTGQLTTVFEENPELPLEDVKLDLFGGARGALITPIACGAHLTTSVLRPWSAPEGEDATPSDPFQITAAPGGGACPTAEGQAPNKPSFTAGTLAPVAGAFSPFVLKLSREDGSQRLTGIDVTLPPGLAARFAGVGECSDAQIAQAEQREKPEQGRVELSHPSCPISSEVGTVDVAAGAGPTPLHVQGHAYLAGPYKGAPLSMAIVTPAVAGPFDLGAVVVRTALYVDPVTAQGRAISDPLPTILDGIPLDVRSIAVRLGRPNFTLNPTSCERHAVSGSASSALGSMASLESPFQVGGCSTLAFRPRLSLRLKGGTRRASHPKLIATLAARPGEANIASASVQLPRSAFLDQAHIRTVCTRVQFSANQCPAGSVYGTATATTPLLDAPLSGNVYLRSSSHKLPDLVVALKGPASLPIEIDLDGKTDSVKGALRNTFEAVPDAPVSKFRLELFGGKRGLVINSRDLCAHRYRAKVKLDGQNGKTHDTTPVVASDCKGSGRQRRGRRRH